MTEVFKAMQSLNCKWYNVHNYRVLCLWRYTSGMTHAESDELRSMQKHTQQDSSRSNIDNAIKFRSPYPGDPNHPILYMDGLDPERGGDEMAISNSNSQLDLENLLTYDQSSLDDSADKLFPGPLETIKIAMSLYKVQQNIYLLDFQRIEVIIRKISSSLILILVCV